MQKNASLKKYNTFGIDAKADWLTHLDSEEQLLTILDDLPNMPKLILGSGSNVLFLDDFKGIVLINEIKGIKILEENDETITIKVKGGENWHDFVMWAVDHNYGGIENLALIPGKVGTAPMQNIGAYGVEVKDVIQEVHTIDMTTNYPAVFSKDDCHFGYRHSIFKEAENKGKYFINAVVFKLHKKNYTLKTTYGAIQEVLKRKNITKPDLKDVAETVMEIRQQKLPDPKKIGNAGSFFKNPFVDKQKLNRLLLQYPKMPYYPTENPEIFKIPAGWLIDQAGFKGKRYGDVGIHPKQALVLVNYGNATGKQIKEVAEKIIAEIKQRYDIVLQPEVNFI